MPAISPRVPCLLAALLLNPCGLRGTAAKRPPNIVVFLAADAGCGDCGINGNRLARTPKIDAIGSDGARFDRFSAGTMRQETTDEHEWTRMQRGDPNAAGKNPNHRTVRAIVR